MMGDFYVRILADLLGPENVVGVEIDADRGAAVAARTGVEHVTDWRTVIDDVDAVAVTLPDHLHLEPTIAALRAGKYVIVEKPLATSTSDSQLILDEQIAPGRLMVAHILRFDPRLQELKRRLDAAEFGSVRYIRIWRTNSLVTADRIRDRVSVNGFLGVHDFDLLLWLTGQNVLNATVAGRKFLGDNWDLAVSSLDLDGGSFAQIENHWLLHPSAQRSCLAGVQVFGDAGMALLDLSTQELEIVSDASALTKRVDTHNWSFDGAMTSGNLRREIEAFTTAVRTAGQVPVSGEDGARAVAVMEMVENALNER